VKQYPRNRKPPRPRYVAENAVARHRGILSYETVRLSGRSAAAAARSCNNNNNNNNTMQASRADGERPRTTDPRAGVTAPGDRAENDPPPFGVRSRCRHRLVRAVYSVSFAPSLSRRRRRRIACRF